MEISIPSDTIKQFSKEFLLNIYIFNIIFKNPLF